MKSKKSLMNRITSFFLDKWIGGYTLGLFNGIFCSVMLYMIIVMLFN